MSMIMRSDILVCSNDNVVLYIFRSKENFISFRLIVHSSWKSSWTNIGRE